MSRFPGGGALASLGSPGLAGRGLSFPSCPSFPLLSVIRERATRYKEKREGEKKRKQLSSEHGKSQGAAIDAKEGGRRKAARA